MMGMKPDKRISPRHMINTLVAGWIIMLFCTLVGIHSPAYADGIDKALHMGAKALAGQNMQKAIKHFDQAIKSGKPTRLQLFTAYSGLCASRYKQSMITKERELTREAIADCDRAIDIKADQQSVYRMRGIAHLSLGSLDSAIADLNVAIALQPDDYLSIQNRGLAKAKLGQSEAALADFDLSIELKPDHPWGYYNRGRLLALAYQYKKSIEDFSTFIRYKQEFAPVYLHRGWSKMRLGHYQQAVGDFYEAIRLNNGDNSVALANRGIALYLLGRYEEAAYDLDRALQIDPTSVESRFWLFLSRGRMGEMDREIFNQDGKVINPKAWPGALSSFLLGRAESQSVLDTIRMTGDPMLRGERESLALFVFGEWAAIRGRNETAQKWYEIIINKAGPKPPWYHAARQQLDFLAIEPQQQILEPDRLAMTGTLTPARRLAFAGDPAADTAVDVATLARSDTPAVGNEPKSIDYTMRGRPNGEFRLKVKQTEKRPAVVTQSPQKIAAPAPEKPTAPSRPAVKQRYPHKPGTYAFKVGAFQSLEHADRALAEVTDLGYGAYLQEINVKGGRFMRVWVGPFATLEEANDARDRIIARYGRTPSKVRLR